MPNVNVKFKPSLSVLSKRFAGVPLKQSLNKNIQWLAFKIEREAKQVTPVDTGRLRASINTKLSDLKATVGPTVFYADFVHWGTRFMRERPFMLWGAETAVKGFDDYLAKELDATIQKGLN